MVWQPGIRLFHSTDLANWSLVGHGLTEADHDLSPLHGLRNVENRRSTPALTGRPALPPEASPAR